MDIKINLEFPYLCYNLKRVLLILFILSPFVSYSQKSNTGTEFWMAFMRNYDSTYSGKKDSLRLYISATNKSNVTIAIPLKGYSAAIQVPKDSVVVFVVPLHLGYITDYDVVKDLGIHITSDFPIAVSAMNLLYATTDASIVLPYSNIPLRTTYIAGNPSTGQTSEIMLVAGDDSTKLKITPTANTQSGYVKNTPFYVTLNRGQLYQIGGKGDLSGSIISVLSNSKLVAFTGDRCSSWPCGACDHEFEQILPNDVLDTAYCIPSHFGATKGYLLKMIPLDSSTDIRVNGFLYKNISRLNPLVIDVKGDSGYYAASNKLFHCHQFLKGAGCSGYINSSYGDPAQLELVSVKHFGESSLFSTVNSFNLKDHFVNVVIKTSAKNNVYLDKTKIDSSEFIPFQYARNYSFAKLKISVGQHLLECSDGLIAYCYGVGFYESYLYLSGFSLPNFDLTFKDSVLNYDCKNQKIKMQFKAKSDKVLKKYTWYFGDNTTGTGNPVQHTYSTIGTYTIKLVAEDFAGKKDSVTRKILVSWPSFDPIRNKIICGIDTVTYQETNNYFTNFKWQDNSTQNYYKAWDNKKVWVTATDTSGYCKFSDSGIVSKINIFSNFFIDSIEKCWKYNRFKFRDSTKIFADQILHKAWVFPFTTVWDKDETTVRFPMPGHYKVYFDVYTTEANCKARYPIDITVHPMPKVFAKVKGESFCSNTPILFYDSSQIVTGKIQSVKWLFDDSTTITNDSLRTFKQLKYYKSKAEVIHFYKHIAISDMGCRDTVTNAALVWPKPVANFTLTIPDTIQCLTSARWTYNSTSTIDADTMNLFWNAGNGKTSTNYFMKNIRYTVPGRYAISLKAVSAFGCEDTKIKHIEVLDIPKVAFFSNDSTQCYKNHLFSFKDTSLGNYLNYYWKLGNGNSSNNKKVDSVKYLSPGLYDVSLKITTPYNGCEDSVKHTIEVLKEPVAKVFINNDTQCLANNNFTVLNRSVFYQPYKSTEWTYDNKSDSNFSILNKIYSDTGNHFLQMVINDKQGCTDTTKLVLRVSGQPKSVLSINDSVQCFNKNRFVFRTINKSGEQNIWKINNQLISVSNSDSFQRVESITGFNIVQLIKQTSNNCKDSISKKYYLLDAPKADFVSNKDTQCFTGHSFNFSDVSVVKNDVISKWKYDIETQAALSTANISNILFNTDGTKKIQLHIITAEGCEDSLSKTVFLLSDPNSRIIGDTVCLHQSANISMQQTAGLPLKQWDWDFGDGNLGTKANEQHLYSAPKSYNLSLTITDIKGCTKTITANNSVLVNALPDATFYFAQKDDGINTTRIKFIPQLVNSNQYFWQFPNGNKSQLDTPVLLIKDLFKGDIQLKVTNAFGCSDSTAQSIYVYPNNFNVYIPNAITLNNDQLNDIFKVEGLGYAQHFKLQITNRWGEEIFYSDDANKGWDGTYQGEYVPEGVYMYAISFSYFDGKKYSFNGTITVLR